MNPLFLKKEITFSVEII